MSLITPRDPRLGVRFGYACTCHESRTRPGPCVHILIAMGYHCGWHQAFDGGRPVDGVCPNCGGPTVEVVFTP